VVRAKVRYFLDEYSKLIRMMAGAEGKEEKVKNIVGVSLCLHNNEVTHDSCSKH